MRKNTKYPILKVITFLALFIFIALVLANAALSAGCGDGYCGSGENCHNCAVDCGSCGPTCGDGYCGSGEDCHNCAVDCGSCGPTCGDGYCGSGEDCHNCAVDCGSCLYCGDGICNNGETCSTCSGDCGACPPVNNCGNGVINSGETCELPNTINNAYCSQSTTGCDGKKTGTRDEIGRAHV
jgi:hypothetical protein